MAAVYFVLAVYAWSTFILGCKKRLGMSDQAGPGVPPQLNGPDEKDKVPNRVVLNESELGNLSIAEFVSHWRQQDTYITSLEQRLSQQEGRYTIHMFVELFDDKFNKYDYELTWDTRPIVI